MCNFELKIDNNSDKEKDEECRYSTCVRYGHATLVEMSVLQRLESWTHINGVTHCHSLNLEGIGFVLLRLPTLLNACTIHTRTHTYGKWKRMGPYLLVLRTSHIQIFSLFLFTTCPIAYWVMVLSASDDTTIPQYIWNSKLALQVCHFDFVEFIVAFTHYIQVAVAYICWFR